MDARGGTGKDIIVVGGGDSAMEETTFLTRFAETLTKVVGARLRKVQSGETKVLDVTGVFVAIGHDPRSELFKGQVETDDDGYVKVDTRAPAPTFGRVRRR